MSVARRLIVLVVFGLFILTLLLRPITRLVSRGFTGEGFDASVLFLAAPGAVVLIVMLFVGIVILKRAEDESAATVGEVLTLKHTAEQPRTSDALREEERGDTTGADDTSAEDGAAEQPDGERRRPSFLSGQGGARNKGFEIEEKPPETDLDDHMQYLREQLGETEFDADAELGAVEELDADAELDAVEEIGADGELDTEADERPIRPGEPGDVTAAESADTTTTNSEPTIPDECPQPYCDANWESGGLFRGRGEHFEVLDGGEQVRCEECGGLSTLE